MEDSLKGLIITLATIALFTTSMLSYIALFPQEQGISFSDTAGNNAYLVVQNNTDVGTQTILTTMNNNSQTAFNQWDITVGFMGSNTVKQTSASGVSGYVSNIFTQLTLMATMLFGTGSPIVYALAVISLVSLGTIIYVVIKFVRQGQ